MDERKLLLDRRTLLSDKPQLLSIAPFIIQKQQFYRKDLLIDGWCLSPSINVEQNLNGVTILTNRVPVIVGNKVVGAIATFRDKTEMQVLAEQLTGVRIYADTLRAQAHEFMNKLHVILGMVHMGVYDKVVEYINKLVDHRKSESSFVTQKIKDPVLAGFLIGKLSYARESGVALSVSCEQPLLKPKDSEVTHELFTIIGNLIDNAIDVVSDSPMKKIEVDFDYGDDILTIEIKDSGAGMSEERQNQIFKKGFSTNGENRGIGLSISMNLIYLWNIISIPFCKTFSGSNHFFSQSLFNEIRNKIFYFSFPFM